MTKGKENFENIDMDKETEIRMKEMWQDMMFLERIKESARKRQEEEESHVREDPGSK